MSRLKDILAKCKFSFVHIVALAALVCSFVMVKFRHVPEKPVVTPGVKSVASLPKDEVDKSPAVEKLKEELAKEAGISKEEYESEAKPQPLAENSVTELPKVEEKVAELPKLEEKVAENVTTQKKIEVSPDEDDALAVIQSVTVLDKPAGDPNIAPPSSIPGVSKRQAPILQKKPKRVRSSMVATAPKVKKRASKRVKKVKPKIEEIAEPLLAYELEADRESPSLGINIVSPLEALVELALTEGQPLELLGVSHGEFLAEAEPEIPVEPRMAVQYHVVEENPFIELRESLDGIRAEQLTLADPPASQSMVAKAEKTVAKPEPTLTKNILVVKRPAIKVAKAVSVQKKVVVKPPIEKLQKPVVTIKEDDEDEDDGNDPEDDDPIVVRNPTPVMEPSIVAENAPIEAAIEEPVTTQNQATPLTTQASVAQVPRAVTQLLPSLSPEKKPEVPAAKVPEFVRPEPRPVVENKDVSDQTGGPRASVTMLHGLLQLEPALSDWLEETQSHVELYLHQKGSVDPVDRKRVDYQFPDEEFQYDVRYLSGDHLLMAYVFSPNTEPKAVQYPALINRTTKERIRFQIRKEQVVSTVADRKPLVVSQTLPLIATVFEAASGDERGANPLAGAEVKVVGFEELGTKVSNETGNVRFPSLPTNSEFLLDVKVKDHFPAQSTVPVFSKAGYAFLHSIFKNKVEAIADFTKNPQLEHFSLLMGRVTELDTRTPKAGEVVTLSHRKGAPVYLSDYGLPSAALKATAGTGLFGFFNVAPSMRPFFQGTDIEQSIPMMLLFKAGYGLYVEFGPSGEGTFRGRLQDIAGAAVTSPCIRFANTNDCVASTDDQGKFEIPHITLPPGTISLEVDTAEFITSLFTLGWHSKEFNGERTLVLADPQESNEKVDDRKGSLVAIADKEFFTDENACVYVELYDNVRNQKVLTQGPFPPEWGRPTARGLCLTQENPQFTFYNLDEGQYVLKWMDANGKVLRGRVPIIGKGRLSVSN